MPRFAANLTMMFNEAPFLERFRAAAAAGFSAAEFLFPYEHTPEEVASAAKAAEIEIVLFNMPAGNWGAGERGITGLSGREDEFRRSRLPEPVHPRDSASARKRPATAIQPSPPAVRPRKDYSCS